MENRGRPTLYTPEIAAAICEKLASGMTLREICKAPDMPHESTVRSWAMRDLDGFSTHYASARELGYHAMADELLEIADDGTNDWVERNDQENPGYQANGENVQRSRLRLDTRKGLLSKALPKVYGDKLAIDHESPKGTMTPIIQYQLPSNGRDDTRS
jgi:hypothetical protein